MNLFKVGRELSEVKETNQSLIVQLSSKEEELRNKGLELEKAEEAMKSLRWQSGSGIEQVSGQSKCSSHSMAAAPFDSNGFEKQTTTESSSAQSRKRRDRSSIDGCSTLLRPLEPTHLVLPEMLRPCRPPSRSRIYKDLEYGSKSEIFSSATLQSHCDGIRKMKNSTSA